MRMVLWQVKPDEARDQWTCTPCVAVGPLHFGTTHDDVVRALNGAKVIVSRGGPPHGDWLEAQFRDLGVTTYYDNGVLACVAVDALTGPQVRLDGHSLVGRAPSVVDQWVIDYTQSHGLDLCYSIEGNAGSYDLGLVMRVQRAGDAVLTRPLLMVRKWAEGMWDYVPLSEWHTF
jgi:hypothetical protein